MLMQERSYSSSAYKYGFNGKEKDNESKGDGNSIYYEARILDPRLGQFISIDPLFKVYLFLSPYSAFGSNPIYFKDNGGMSLEVGGNKQKALTDIQSLVSVEYRAQIIINTAGEIEFKNYNALPDKVKNYEGIKLVNDLISSPLKFKYSVGDQCLAGNSDRIDHPFSETIDHLNQNLLNIKNKGLHRVKQYFY